MTPLTSRTMHLLRTVMMLLALAAGSASAQAPADVRAADALDLAIQLAERGRAEQNALPLLAAVEILLAHPPQAIADDDAGLDVMALLADAGRLGSANADVSSLVVTFRRRAEAGVRGATSGPRASGYQLAPSASEVIRLAFVPGARAAVRVRAAAGRRIDCDVLAADGKPLASDRATSGCFLNFTPATDAPLRIVVRNTSTSPARVVVITN